MVHCYAVARRFRPTPPQLPFSFYQLIPFSFRFHPFPNTSPQPFDTVLFEFSHVSNPLGTPSASAIGTRDSESNSKYVGKLTDILQDLARFLRDKYESRCRRGSLLATLYRNRGKINGGKADLGVGLWRIGIVVEEKRKDWWPGISLNRSGVIADDFILLRFIVPDTKEVCEISVLEKYPTWQEVARCNLPSPWKDTGSKTWCISQLATINSSPLIRKNNPCHREFFHFLRRQVKT